MAAKNLTYQFKTSSVLIKIIVINAVIFLGVRLLGFFMQVPPESLTSWFVLPEELGVFITQPWSIITYSFLHFGFWHILWNMLILYWFGKYVLNLFGEKRFLTIYLLGAIAGGLLYMLAYNLFPVFSNTIGVLLGASAAVRAIMIFIAAYSPHTEMRVFFFNVKLWHIGVFVVLLDLVQISTSTNAGGLIAHLGGALFGYVYAIQLVKGNDIGKWFESIMDWFADLFKPRKQKPFRKVHRSKKPVARKKKEVNKDDNQKKVDAILDKIGKSGYDSLTKEEKDFLFKAGKED